MGYKIPPPDFTLPPMEESVAEKGLTSLADNISKGFAMAMAANQKAKAEAEKLNKEKSKARNKILNNQYKQKTTFNKGLQEKGIVDDENKSDDLFDQFGKEVDFLGDQALEAQLVTNFSEFDDDDTTLVTDALNLTDAQKKLYVKDGRISRSNLLDIVNNFDAYTSSSMEEMGGLLADTKTLLDPTQIDKAIVVGDRNTGEQMANEIALTNVGIGGNGEAFDVSGNASATRTLEREGNNNFIVSKVTIPGSSDYLKDNMSIINSAKNNGKLYKGIVENSDGSYTFTSRIPVTGYASENGMDLVVDKIDLMKPNATLEAAGVYKNNTWSDQLVDLNTVKTTEDLDNKQTRNTEFNLIDMSKAQNSTDFLIELNTTYGNVFKSPNYTNEQRDQYLLDLGITESWAEVSKKPNHEDDIKRVMRSNVFDTFMTSSYQNGVGGQQTIQVDDNNKSYDSVLAQAVSAGMIDPITGKPYEAGKKGQILYALASEKITTTPKESTDGKSDTRRRFSNFKNNLEKFKKQGSIILPNTNGNIVAWDGKQFLLYEKDPVTSVMNEGTPKDPEEVKEIFGLYE
jgi:hypothetical protein